MSENSLVEKNRISIRLISKNVAKEMIVKYHYSHAWTTCSYALGIFYSTDVDHTFLDEKEEKMIGVLIYGNPVGRSAIKAISDELELDACLELTRLFIHDGYGKNVESVALGKSFEWIKKHAKKIRVLISYSDPEQNHLGIIYQATNWMYQGAGCMNLMPNFSISLTKPYDWIHSRTVFEQFGSHNIEHLKKTIGKTFWRKQEPFKHRYVYFVCDKREKRRLIKSSKHPFLPYPKDMSKYVTPVEEYIVEEKREENKFF